MLDLVTGHGYGLGTRHVGTFQCCADAQGATPLLGLNSFITRWKGKKTLDHVYTNQLYLCSKVEVVELKLSDHRPLKFTLVQKWMEEQTRHVLSPLGCWQCPQRFTDYEWTEHLKKVWTQHPEVLLLNHLPKDVDVDIEWNSITASSMTCLTVARRSLVPLKTDQLVSRVTMSKSSRLLREFALILVT